METIKSWAMALLGILSAVLVALLYRGKAKREKERREAAENAREVESNATNSLIEGLKKEQEAKDAIDITRRDHFSS